MWYNAKKAFESTVQCAGEHECDTLMTIDYNRYVYCLNIMALDESIGEIVGELEDNGLWDNPLIIFTSNNGGMPGPGGCNIVQRKSITRMCHMVKQTISKNKQTNTTLLHHTISIIDLLTQRCISDWLVNSLKVNGDSQSDYWARID